MAQQDYLSKAGGQFGTLAGSILSDRRRRKKKDAITALAISAFVETLGAKNRQLDQELKDSLENINTNYTNIFQNNAELYRLAEDDRKDYLDYVDDKEGYLNKKAIESFNVDPIVTADKDLGNYSNIGNLDDKSREKALEIFNDYKEKEKQRIESRGKDPAVYITTPTKFNELIMNEFNAAIAQVKDDPTKQGAIKGWFSKNFGEGTVKQAELKESLENARRLREKQQRLVKYSDTYEGKEEIKIQEIVEANKKATSEIQESNPDYFDFKTNIKGIEEQQKALSKKFNTANYVLNIDDLHSAGELGVPIPGFSGFNRLIADERETLVSASKKARTFINNNQNPLDFLSGDERRVYAIAIGTSVLEYENKKLSQEISRLNIDKAKQPLPFDVAELNSLRKDENYLATVKSGIEDAAFNKGETFTEAFNRLSTEDMDAMIDYVVQTAATLRYYDQGQKYKAGRADNLAVMDAIEIQIGGLYKSGEGLFGREQYGVEYVDPFTINILDEEINSIEDAETLKKLLNTKKYIQNKMIRTGPSVNDRMSLSPDKEGKVYDDESSDYIFITALNEKTGRIEWTYLER